ncbi:hypothetical protein GCM10027091_56570 [Streptomyces daliensis]
MNRRARRWCRIAAPDRTPGNRDDSPYCRLLNSKWRFRWSENPDRRPEGFHRPGYDGSAWDRIPVPSNKKTEKTEGCREPVRLDIEYPWTGYEKPAPP